MRALSRIAAWSLGIGAVCVAYGTFLESAAFRVRRVTAPVLEPGSGPLRVLHLSDAHLLPWHRRRKAFLASLVGLEPDLVVCTGDLIGSSKSVTALEDALGRLLTMPGVFVLGSNDFRGPKLRNPFAYLWRTTESNEDGSHQPDELRTMLTGAGWIDLDDDRTVIDVQGVRLDMRGTGDAHKHHDHYDHVSGPAQPDTVPLGVTHAPYARVLDAMADDHVRLVFAGHTHGGQVCLPFHGALTTNCDLPTARAKGLHEHRTDAGAACLVNVSAGVGMSPTAPFRFACPPEVTLVTLAPRRIGTGAGHRLNSTTALGDSGASGCGAAW